MFGKLKNLRKSNAKMASPAVNDTHETAPEDNSEQAESNTGQNEPMTPTNQDKPVRRRRERPWKNPLFYFACALSLGSLAWTGYGIYDLLNKHVAGLAVALVADLIWAGVLIAEVQGARIRGKEWPVTAIGWAAVTAVVALLVMHGVQLDNMGWIVAAPLVPYGAKIMWMFTLTAPYDPTVPTEREQEEINNLLRETSVEVQKMEAQRLKDEAEVAALNAENDKQIARIQAASRRAQAMQIAQMEAGIMPPVIRGHVVREGSDQVRIDSSDGSDMQLTAGSDEVRTGFGPSSGTFGFSSAPVQRGDRIEHIRTMIGLRGGDPNTVPLKEIEDLYGVSKATASQMRKEAGERD